MNKTRPQTTVKTWLSATACVALAGLAVSGLILPALAAEDEGERLIAATTDNLREIHRAALMYSVDFGAVEDVPGAPGMCQGVIGNLPSIERYVPKARLFSPAAPMETFSPALASTYAWPMLRPRVRGSDGREAQVSFDADPARFVYAYDYAIDSAHFYPLEGTRDGGMLLVELSMDGQIRTVRRPIPRMSLEMRFRAFQR